MGPPMSWRNRDRLLTRRLQLRVHHREVRRAKRVPSLVSFERVFEVLDLPLEIASKSGAHLLQDVRGVLEFDDVTFRYSADERCS